MKLTKAQLNDTATALQKIADAWPVGLAANFAEHLERSGDEYGEKKNRYSTRLRELEVALNTWREKVPQ